MSFISVLFALLLEQARPLARGNPIHIAMRVWIRWCARTFDTGKSVHGWMAWGLAVVGPAVGALVVYWLLCVFVAWPLAVFWSVLVLYATLGFRQFSFHFTQIRDALVNDDNALAMRLLADWQRIDTNDLTQSEVIGEVIRFSVLAAHRHVFGVLVWFSLLAAFGLGPTGAVLYRLSEFVARYWHHHSESHHQPISAALLRNAQQAWGWIDWLPARVTAIGFAVVGNFEEAINGWRHYALLGAANNDSMVLAATAGALNIDLSGTGAPASVSTYDSPSQSDDAVSTVRPQLELAHLATVVGLVWRSVVLWMVLLALLTLARLLG